MLSPQYLKSIVRKSIKPLTEPRLPSDIKAKFEKMLSTREVFYPRIIHIETRSLCNGKCSFCAAAVQFNTRPDITMTDGLVDKILNELKDHGYKNRLSFYNNNEPFLDKRIYDIIAKARSFLPSAYLELKTNGTAVNFEKICKIFNAGLDTLYINDYQPMELVRQGKHKKNIEDIAKELEHSRRFKGHYHQDGYHSRVLISLRDEGEVLGNRAGTSPNGKDVVEPLSKPCLRPFEMMTIDPKGNVALCSEDLEFAEIMGNVAEKSIFEIWNSEEYLKVRQALLHGDRGIKSTCAKCDYKGFTFEVVEEIRQDVPVFVS